MNRWLAALLLVASSSLARANDDVAPLGSFATARALDLEGRVHVIGDDARLSVIVFLDTECPIANQYLPELATLAKEHPQVAVYGVYSEPTLTRAKLVEHKKSYQTAIPVILDASGELASRLRPRAVPEAFLVKEGQVLYRGRIDDRWEKLGKQRERAPKKDLALAVEAALKGAPVPVATTEPVGCLLQLTKEGALPASVTHARDVAPLLFASCVSCHHAGGIAPFALDTYAVAKKHAKTIATVTETRYMPPWHATPGVGHFEDERRLSDREIALLAAWVAAGTPEGDAADLPPAPTFAHGWTLGEPDLVVAMPKEYDVPASGADIYRAFVLKADIPEDRYVVATEFKPGAPSVVHHCLVYLDNTGAARQREEKAGGFGYPSFGGPGFIPSGSLGGWAPGAAPRFLPEGTGRLVKANSDVVVQIHYHPDGKAEKDRSQLALYFAKKPVDRPVSWLSISNNRIDIPANEKDYKREANLTLPCPVTVIGVTPHMHLLGKTMKASATLPSGEVVPLVDVTWDFRWQDQYQYKTPLRLPEGTKIHMEAVFDNSSDNSANPNDPPRRVRFGEQTTDEMCFLFLTVAFDSKADQRKARRSIFEERFKRE